MLIQLAIRNYATVECLDLDLAAGMSVLTGETGAGKSIILGALGLTLGDRADLGVIRSGASKTDISAVYDIQGNERVMAWLKQHDLQAEETNDCLIRRVLSTDSRSKASINGYPVTLANLRSLGEMLIDIHSQHEHQSLLHKLTHQRLLDEFSLQKPLAASVHDTWKKWQANGQVIKQLSSQSQESSAQSQLLSYQLLELDELDLQEQELDELDAQIKQLSLADETTAALHEALAICADNDANISQGLSQVLTLLREKMPQQQAITNITSLLETAAIQIDEAVDELRSQLDKFEANPQRLEQLNNRLAAIHTVARKHHVKANELSQLCQDLREQLSRLQNSDEELQSLHQQDELLRQQFTDLAAKLSKHRRKAALSLAKQINTQLASLGMGDAKIVVQLNPLDTDDPSPRGMESVEFLVSTNPGQEPKPLIKIASGGELSRISLAIQVITAKTSNTPTLVFDEVDVGIGGGVAKAVGELLRHLGASAQILCVTHQAQVASLGHQHYLVSKKSSKNNTLTHIEALSESDKIKEVARMLGGDSFSDESLAHAQQMVAN